MPRFMRHGLLPCIAAMAALCACGHTPGASTPAAGAYAWPVAYCPSTEPAQHPSTHKEMFLGGVGEVFLGTLIQAGVNSISAALTEAAAADRNGTAVSGRQARYLYSAAAQGTGATEQTVAQAAGCLIVLVPGKDASPAFCDNSDVASAPALQAACMEPKPNKSGGRTILDCAADDSTADCVRDDGSSGDRPPADASLPKFYAEIALQPANDLSAVRPSLVNLYYPTAFDPRRAGATRDLAITVQISSPDDKAVANVLVAVPGLVPEDRQHEAKPHDLSRATGLWTVLPKYNGVALTAKSGHRRVGAVNVNTEIRETGQLNRFLQAFAAAFEADKKKYVEAASATLLPSARENAAAADLKGKVAVAQARAALAKAQSDLEAACSKSVDDKGYVSAAQKALELDRQRQLISAAWQALRAAEVEHDLPVERAEPPKTCSSPVGTGG